MGGEFAATGRGRPARLRQNEVADLLGITTRHLRRMAQTSEAHGLEVPRVGSGRRQRWKAEELLPWHDRDPYAARRGPGRVLSLLASDSRCRAMT